MSHRELVYDRSQPILIESLDRSNINPVGAGLCHKPKPEINLIQTCPTPPVTSR